MSDDLDNLLRRAMKTLDDQVPPGYFEDFANQTLARLEDSSMQDEPNDAIAASRSAEAVPAAEARSLEVKQPAPIASDAEAKPPATEPKEREEDSGLHDIRSLASPQRMRLSRRSSQNMLRDDDELLASASSSWKAVALPEPAKMISLPDVAELPPAAEVKEDTAATRPSRPSKIAKAVKAAEAAEAKEVAKEVAKAAAAATATATAAEAKQAEKSRRAAAVEQPAAVTPITAAKPKAAAKAPGSGRRNALIATTGIGLAAAAGALVFVATARRSEDAAKSESLDRPRAAGAMPELQRIEAPGAAAPEPTTGAGSAAPAADSAKLKIAEPPPTKGKVEPPAVEKPGKSMGKLVPNVVEDDPKPEKKDDAPKKPPEPGDPDFDKLLKEAGYQEKKAEAPKLDKKMLSGDDIKKGMNAINAKVLSCYAGTQGTASVKLTVLPTGQIQKVTVTGQFAGTPVGACVEGAVQMVSFPPWDGPPQSVSYSYLLAE